MNKRLQTVLVTIMGKEYKIACEQHEQENLLKSAHDLNEQMCKMRDSGKVIGPERIAVMAALNLSHELQTLRSNSSTVTPIPQSWKVYLSNMVTKIENVLDNP
jgi:cell division protein ZapA